MRSAVKIVGVVVVAGFLLSILFFSAQKIDYGKFFTSSTVADPEQEHTQEKADSKKEEDGEEAVGLIPDPVPIRVEPIVEDPLPVREEVEIVVPPEIIVSPIQVAPPELPTITHSATTTSIETLATSTATTSVAAEPPSPPLPPLDEKALLRAVVKIQCPTVDNTGIYVGSAFLINPTTVVTAAHVVMNAGSQECDVIFPNERKPIHYLRGTLEDIEVIKERHDEEGIDVARLSLRSLDSYPEAKAIFNDSYPFIPYPICKNPVLFGDTLLHFGYPSNFKDQSYLSKLEGEVVALADINGITSQLSLDQTVVYKTPVFAYSNDETVMHPYLVSRVPSFYGDSGGLAFNKTKQCILGVHRGGSIGRAAGENFTIFMNLGWADARVLLPSP